MINDEQLIALVLEKRAEELTLDEVGSLRDRLAQSAELRQTLIHQQHREEYLSAALGRIDTSLESVLEQVEERSPEARGTFGFVLLFSLIVIVFVGSVLVYLARPSLFFDPGHDNGDEVAQAESADDAVREEDTSENQDNDGQSETGTEQEPAAGPDRETETAEDDTADHDESTGNATPGTSDVEPDKPHDHVPSGEPSPWDPFLKRPPLLFSEVWLAEFTPQEGPLSRDDLRKWFAPVAGQNARFHETRHSDIMFGKLEGVFRFQPPLQEGVVWKMAVRDSDKFRIHVFAGEEGVSIHRYNQDEGRWAAFATRREAGQPIPSSFFLTATDDSRANRTEAYYASTYLIWYDAGELVMSLGDIEILRAPLAGPPSDVYFEGKATFDGMTLAPTDDLPQRQPELPVVAEMDRPADLEWLSELPEGVEIEKCSDGGVALQFDGPKSPGWIAAPLPDHGLCVVDVFVEEASLGTSVFLGAAERRGENNQMVPEGRPESVVSVFRNQHSKLPNLYEGTAGDWGVREHWHQLHQYPERRVEPPFYVRLLASPGQMRYWISKDGVHWAGAFYLHEKDVRNVRYVGIGFANGLEGAGRIKLRKIVQRELSELSSLAREDVLRQALAVPEADDVGQWLVTVTEAAPAGQDLGEWQRACALKTLAAGCGGRLGHRLLHCLLTDAAERLPVERCLAVHREAALLTSTWTNEESHREQLRSLVGKYRLLGERAQQESDDVQPFSLIRHAMLTAPISTRFRERVFDPALIRDEFIRLNYGAQWNRLDRVAREVEFYSGSEDYLKQAAPLAEWARATAARHLNSAGQRSTASLNGSWRHPVVEELSKEAFNAHAELEVALASNTMRDACRVIGGVGPSSLNGLVPCGDDPDLLVSLPTAVRFTVRDYPELRTTMNAEFASVAQVRVQRAMSENDPSAVKMITIQFFGTPAAAQAHQWLGDRALSGGQFGEALTHYGQAARLGPETNDADLAARVRLAAAMLGLEEGDPVKDVVRIGSLQISASEFEKLVEEMRSTHGNRFVQGTVPPTLIAGLGGAPGPSAFRFQEKGRFDAYPGGEPSSGPSGVRERGNHWLDRQMSCVTADNTLYISTRFQVVAFDANSGQRKWLSPTVPDANANVLDWPLIPMRPLIAKQHVFVRQMARKSPALVCLDRNNGQHKWVYQGPDDEWLVSDPFAARGQLFALTMQTGDATANLLELTQFDIESGQVLDRWPAVRLRDTWTDYRVCQVTADDDAFVAVLGGAVLSMDYAGHVRWLRRQPLMPAKEDRDWVRQDHQPPLLYDGRLYVVSPGVRTVDCVDPETGRLIWRRVLPNVERLMGFAADRFVVQTTDAILAIEPDDGTVAWRHATRDPLVAQLCGPRILYSRRITWVPPKNLRTPELVWLDVDTGREIASQPIPEMQHDWPRFTALINTGSRLWAICGGGEERHRRLAELAPSGPVSRRAPAKAPDVWRSHIPEKLSDAARVVLPEWQILNALDTGHTGLLDQVQGEREVLGIGPTKQTPVVFAREVEIPALGKPRLKMRVAGSHGRKWQVDVAFGGETVFTEQLPDGNNWKSLDVDLSSLAGRQGILTVRGEMTGGEYPANIYWKSMQLVY